MTKAERKQGDPPTHEEDPIVSIPEAARQIGKSRQTVWKWVTDGLMAHVNMPGAMKGVRKSVINKLLRGSNIEQRVE